MSQPSFKDVLKADMILADQYAAADELRWAARIYRQLARSLGASLGGSDDWPERVGGAIHATLAKQQLPPNLSCIRCGWTHEVGAPCPEPYAMFGGSGSPGDRTA